MSRPELAMNCHRGVAKRTVLLVSIHAHVLMGGIPSGLLISRGIPTSERITKGWGTQGSMGQPFLTQADKYNVPRMCFVNKMEPLAKSTSSKQMWVTAPALFFHSISKAARDFLYFHQSIS